VVIQHLSPDYKSLMVELLSRKTEIPVHRAEDGMVVQPNHIYLIPPKKNLTLFHGKLLLEDQKPREGINLPVDIFLRSLAEDQGEQAVGVILSGTGSDGTRGVRAVKEWGGLVMVQDEASAKFDGMPRAAASTGVADFILPPDEMPSQLVACLRHPYATRQDRQEQTLSNETGLTRLFSLLRARTKVDFTYYKPSTITRRIERRIAVTQVADLDAYVQYVEETPSEISVLYRELLIGVTSFFRDPQVMTLVQETVLPNLFEHCADREIRFWVAGCSTGEEAYTLAILAREVMAGMGLARDIKIFATDIDRDAVARAGSGSYPESIAADLNPSLLAKYFYCRGDTYQVTRTIREMVVFAQHNLVKDPPFTRIDLVSCRNLLIYLQTNLQQRALEMFSFSLRPGGVLILGNSETVGEMEDRFEPVDRKARIYRSLGRQGARAGLEGMETGTQEERRLPLAATGYSRPTRIAGREQERLIPRLLEVLADAYVPLTVVVNEHLEIVYTVGDPSGVFTLPSGRAVLDISKMVNRELAIPLATGIQKVFRTGDELVYTNVRLREADNAYFMRLRMRSLPGRRNDEALVIVFFERVEETVRPAEDAAAEYDLDEETSQRLQDLEQELQFTRENLQATIEELETSNEELQATNEELLASNEELQSTNEELQSTNEELYTVNAEYQNKIIELTEVQNDVDNLLSSSRIGTLILDEDLCIRRYSPQAAPLFHLVESDVGRPLKHLTHQLLDFDPVAVSREVQRSGKLVEQDVQAEDGRWHLVRILPYHIGPHTFAGVVITLIDVTPLRDIRERLECTERAEADILRHMPSGLFVYDVTEDGDLLLKSGNPAAEKITGLDVNACVGKRFLDLWPGEQGARLHEAFLKAFQKGEPVYEPEVVYQDDRFGGVFHVHAFRLSGNRLAVGFEDITERS
jgi:two-component system, chemotaxis family, CheB/CheR fusion protein